MIMSEGQIRDTRKKYALDKEYELFGLKYFTYLLILYICIIFCWEDIFLIG